MSDTHRQRAPFRIYVREPFQFRRNLTGVIYLVCCGEVFPAESWSDFPVIVLSWWADAVLRLQKGATKREDLCFMDGPFIVRLEGGGPMWRLTAMQERASGAVDVRTHCMVPAETVLHDVRTAGRDLLLKCEHEQWITDDLEALKARVTALHAWR